MEKMNITGMGTTDEKRSYYILVKEALVEKLLNEVMREIGYDPLYYGEGDSPTECENRVDHVMTRKYDIDIIYTSNRIVLIVRASKEQQKIFRDLLFSYSKFPEK